MLGLLPAAFAAGMVATVNPCGFAMLPAYLGYFLAAGGDERVTSRRLASVAIAVSAGFVAVFSVAGALITAGLRGAIGWVPWMAAVVGAVLLTVGLGVLTGRYTLPTVPGPGRVRHDPSLAGMFVFGLSYGVASLSCTLPIFLSLLAGAVAGAGYLEAAATFVSYGGGMTLVLAGITVALALGRESLIRRMRRVGRHLERVSGIVLAAAGGFILWYWGTVLSSGAAAFGRSGVIRRVDRVAAALTALVDERLVLTIVVLVILAGGVALARRRRR